METNKVIIIFVREPHLFNQFQQDYRTSLSIWKRYIYIIKFRVIKCNQSPILTISCVISQANWIDQNSITHWNCFSEKFSNIFFNWIENKTDFEFKPSTKKKTINLHKIEMKHSNDTQNTHAIAE